jgi:YVTN family beta-propeller protein
MFIIMYRMSNLLLCTVFALSSLVGYAQLSGSRSHSHNDYEQKEPFFAAYREGFNSIEADVWLVDGKLLVGHDQKDLQVSRTLEDLYLKPLSARVKENKGRPYKEKGKTLQLMIDIKSEAVSTLDALTELLRNYPKLSKNRNITVTVSGNRPPEEKWTSYPSYIRFDGRPAKAYTADVLTKVSMISDSYAGYLVSGTKQLDIEKATKAINEAHALDIPFRFWGNPDDALTWQALKEIGVDYINTDHISQLATFLKDPQRHLLNEKLGKITLHDSPGIMPYNRMIKSAGQVIRFGDPAYENHSLDITPLTGTDLVVVLDRYGVFAMDLRGNIIDRYTPGTTNEFRGLMSTYSGVKTFRSQNKTWITWSVARDTTSYILFAEWNGRISNVTGMKTFRRSPARNAIPNEIYADEKEEVLYLLLNGNDEIMKIRWADKAVIWKKSAGGVAPFGLTMANGKLYVTNWGGPFVSDSTRVSAGVPWGSIYTDPRTGASAEGTVSVIDPSDGKILKEIKVGLHPNVVIRSGDQKFVFVSNGNSDDVSVINTRTDMVSETIPVGMFQASFKGEGSSPNGLSLSTDNTVLYVSNGMDNAVAVVRLGRSGSTSGKGQTKIEGYIPTESYPSGTTLIRDTLVVANLESEGANVITPSKGARGIHYQLGSVSIIPVPEKEKLVEYTKQVYESALQFRYTSTMLPPRPGVAPVPVPERIGEPSVFKHVVYIIKENKTYDQVYGDLPLGRGDSSLCVFGERITPNMHALARQYGWMDNYYASGKSSAEGHQWSNAAIVSDYVQKNVRAWFRSYPHRQTDAMVYNKSGYIWNQAMEHGKKVRIYGEACTTIYDNDLKWLDMYRRYQAGEKPNWKNTSTIDNILPVISPEFPDNDNMVFSDQQRADIFIKEWDEYEKGDSLPDLMILSLPNDHSAGTSPNFPTPNAMVADNDLAVGRIIERISKSRYFDSTVILITQDDSQSGWDHISAYRTVGLAISAYPVEGVVTTNYNQTSMVRTIEQILGIPPMNILDATATPMFDCFSKTKNSRTYTALGNNVPLDEMNKPLSQLKGKDRKYAIKSMNELYNEVDGGRDDEMNEIIKHYVDNLQKR